jgi:hypothetical protein
MVYLLKMVIFYSYVKLPEGISMILNDLIPHLASEKGQEAAKCVKLSGEGMGGFSVTDPDLV